MVHLPISEDYSLLQDYASEGAWKKCIRICRFQNNLKLWAVLALEATRMDELGALETALLAMKAVEKLEHVRFIQKLPEGEVRFCAMIHTNCELNDSSSRFETMIEYETHHN